MLMMSRGQAQNITSFEPRHLVSEFTIRASHNIYVLDGPVQTLTKSRPLDKSHPP